MFTYKRNIKEGAKKSINGQGSLDDKKDVNQNIGSWIWAILSVLVVATYPVFFLYFQNADEAAFSEVVLPLIVFIATGFVFFVLFLLITKNIFKAAIIANMFMLVFMNYALLESGVQAIFSTLSYWHVLPIFLFILAHLAWFITKKVSKNLAETVSLVICIVFSSLILFNGIISVPTIINKISNEKQVKEQMGKTAHIVDKDTDLPNIYYLIFDEYSSIDFMKKYYDYDNSAFTDYLESIGFNVSYTSHNESILSSTIMTNIVNLDYVVTDKTEENEKTALRVNSVLYQMLLKLGYKIQEVGDGSIFQIEPMQDKFQTQAKTSSGDNLSDILYRNTIIQPFYVTTAQGYAEVVMDSIEYMTNLDNFTGNSEFIAFHLNLPHCPFSFDENGNRISSLHYIDWADRNFYLGQYKYTTKLMQDMVKSIIEKNPNAIIILQSDHSARAMEDPKVHKTFNYDDITNFFNAVYYHNDRIDIEGLSGINTMITVLNSEFNLNIPLKEIAKE